MKTKIIIFLSAIFMLSFNVDTFAQEKKKNNKEEVLFDVSLHCHSCQKKIEKQVAFEKGVTDLKVNLPEKTVWVQYKADKTDAAKLKAFIESLGYEVAVHQEEADVN
ncbi:cation transporter [Dysgonomonas sp. 520]|uniref:cation transporter n=1 Tax=Dysgonomonas sp. 520 TaxID=2302931 RepID=UPI0013D507A8|nr:heavy metal-associated domain-containing protein [Dysgonomonas sp. 520]NDW08187.1 heavy-metal-associated domain-containing protein [Dysgonomonas sp. 520]